MIDFLSGYCLVVLGVNTEGVIAEGMLSSEQPGDARPVVGVGSALTRGCWRILVDGALEGGAVGWDAHGHR